MKGIPVSEPARRPHKKVGFCETPQESADSYLDPGSRLAVESSSSSSKRILKDMGAGIGFYTGTIVWALLGYPTIASIKVCRPYT